MKRFVALIVFILILTACLCTLFACAGDNKSETPSNYIISFNTNGGTQIKSITLKSGSSLDLPEPPTKEGFVFIGWFFDNKLEREVNVALFKVVSNTTIFAGWESVETYRHKIIVPEFENGSVTVVEPSDSRASMGTEVIVSVTPDDGYELSYGGLKANDIILEHESASRYKFTMPANEVTLSAKFDLKPMAVNAIEMIENGEIVLSTDSARRGDLVTVQAIPSYGYRLTELFVINNEINAEDMKINIISTGSFYMGSADTFVGAVFEKIDYSVEYAINTVSNGGGDILLSATKSPAGLFVTLAFAPYDGYLLDRYVVQGEGFLNYVNAMDEGFIMPEEDVTVTAYFTPNNEHVDSYELTITNSSNGTISLVNPKNHYKKGEIVEFEVVPNDGYRLEKVYLNGTPVLSNSFRMPSRASTLSCEFVESGYDIGVVASNCEVVLSKKSAYPGERIYFEVIEFDGYKVSPSKLTINGEPLSGNSFVMPEEDVTISAIAYATGSVHHIVPSVVEGGVIIPSEVNATIYTKIKINAIPHDGYRLKANSLKVIYYSQGTKIEQKLTQSTFVMPDTDVTISGEFERVYKVEATDDGVVGIYPDRMEIGVGESVHVSLVGHGNVIENSIEVQVIFGRYTEKLDLSRVFELNQDKINQAGAGAKISFTYENYSEIDVNRIYSISTMNSVGGQIIAPNSQRYGDVVKLAFIIENGYQLDSIRLTTNAGDSYSVSDSFIMPQSPVVLSATFKLKEESSFGLKSQYENNIVGFNNAMMKVIYYREKYQIIESYPALEEHPFINYVVGAVKVDAKYGHDFYIIEVDDISRVTPIAHDAHEFISSEIGVDKGDINVKINYNYIILSVGGDPNEDFYLYKNGVKLISDFILYERKDGTYGVYAYLGDGGYLTILDSLNGRDVTYLSSKAFLKPELIKGIALSNVTEIGDFALENTKISKIDLSRVEKLGVGVFKNAEELEKITVSSYNQRLYALSGVLYLRGKTSVETLYCYPQSRVANGNFFDIPSQTHNIAPYAFFASSLKTVSYGGALEEIGDYAFAESALESIKYTSATAVPGVADFSNTNSNKSVVSFIGDGAFSGVGGIFNYYLDSVKEIGKGAITWSSENGLVINLSGRSSAIIESDFDPIVKIGEPTSLLIIYVPRDLLEHYSSANGWGIYKKYFTVI